MKYKPEKTRANSFGSKKEYKTFLCVSFKETNTSTWSDGCNAKYCLRKSGLSFAPSVSAMTCVYLSLFSLFKVIICFSSFPPFILILFFHRFCLFHTYKNPSELFTRIFAYLLRSDVISTIYRDGLTRHIA